MKCTRCPLEKTGKTERLPKNWRKTPDTQEPLCPVCWKRAYMPRTITLPIAGPARGDQWPALREALYKVWGAATRLSNWAARQLLKNDITRDSTMHKLPPMPAIYLYGLFGQYLDRHEWEGMAASAQCLMRSVEMDYRERRLEAIWRANRNVDSYKWPQPFLLHNANYEMTRDADGLITVSLPLGGARWNLRIRNDRTVHGRYRRMIDDCLVGRTVLGEAKLYARPVGPNDDRNGIYLRNPAGGESRMYRILIGIAGWFPRPEFAANHENTLNLSAGNDSFVYAEQEGHDLWTINGDAMRQRILAYSRFRLRLSQDTKHERRIPKRRKRQLLDAGERRATTENDRQKSFREETTTWVADLARRRKCGTLIWHGGEMGFLPSFPWFMWIKRLKDKLEERNIVFVDQSKSVESAVSNEESEESVA